MITEIKNTRKENMFVDVEGTHIPVNATVPATKVIRSFRTVADMENRKFRRLFNRHKIAYRY